MATSYTVSSGQDALGQDQVVHVEAHVTIALRGCEICLLRSGHLRGATVATCDERGKLPMAAVESDFSVRLLGVVHEHRIEQPPG